MPAKKSAARKPAARKKNSRSIVSKPSFSRRSFTIFGLAFAVVGAFFLFRIFAAEQRVDYFGSLTANKPTVSYKLTTGTGNMKVTFSNNTADVTLSIKDKAGKTVGSIKSIGKKNVVKTFSVAADTYTVSLDTKAKFTGKKGYHFTISYPSKDMIDPTAVISSPLNKETVAGTVTFAAMSQGETAIDRIEFFVDGNLLKADVTSPYSVPWDTTKYTNGDHTISIKTFDSTNKVGEASGVVEVNNTATPPPPPTPAPTSGSFDTVMLRPPKDKLLLGASMPDNGYATAKSLRGKDMHISHAYSRSAAEFKTRINETPAGTIPLINFKPGGAMGAAEYKKILAGDRDAAIKEAAAAAKAYGKRFFFAPLHEPENDDKTSPYPGDADYAKAFTYIVNMMKSNGANNIVVTWNMMGYGNWMSRYDKLYPGDGVVDWIASDPYSWGVNETLNNYHSVKEFYAWAVKKNKPMMWAEWGIDKATGSAHATTMLSQAGVDAVQKDMPLILGMVYWSEAEYHLTNFQAQWKTFSNLPEFNWALPAGAGK